MEHGWVGALGQNGARIGRTGSSDSGSSLTTTVPAPKAAVAPSSNVVNGGRGAYADDDDDSVRTLETAEDLNNRGKSLFGCGSYEAAASMYTQALHRCPRIAKYHINRALCYKNLSKWQLVVADGRRAVKLSPNSVRGHYLIGMALSELGQLEEALQYLEIAFKQSKVEQLPCTGEICKVVHLTKKKKWEREEEQRLSEEIELEGCLSRLLAEERRRVTGRVKERCNCDESLVYDNEVERITTEFSKHSGALERLLEAADERRRRRKVPEYMIDSISYSLIRDPVITPSGVTYDRDTITEHLQKVGEFDPVSRAKLTVHDLVPNLALKQAIDDFVDHNGWVEDY